MDTLHFSLTIDNTTVQLLPQHEPGIHARGHVLAGHIHPVVSIGQQYQRAIRCPCFWHQPQCTVLPAFGHFTGGYRVTPAKDDQVFVAGAERVIPVSPKAMSQSKHGARTRYRTRTS